MKDPAGGLRIKKKGGGALHTALGAGLVLFPLIFLLSQPEQVLPLPIGAYLGRLFLAAFFFCGVKSLARGIRARMLVRSLERLNGLFDNGSRVPLTMAEEMLGCGFSALVRDVRAMQRKKMVQGLYADLIRGDLVYIGNKAVIDLPADPPKDDIVWREEHKKSALPIYMLGLAWVVYAAFLPLYRTIDFVIAAILSLIVFVVSSWTAPARVVVTARKPEQPQPAATGNQALDEMLTGVTAHISNLRALDRAIDGKLDNPVRDILKTTEQIVEHVRKKPVSASEIRQFFNYTLPTTIDLLQNYDELSRQPVQGKNIVAAMEKIEGMIDSIVEAFHRQLDALFREKALDIDVELEVMRNMLNQTDGISGD